MRREVAERINEILVIVGNHLKDNGTITESKLKEYIMVRYLLSETAVARNINTLKMMKTFEYDSATKEFSLPSFVIVEQPEKTEKTQDDSRATA